MKFKWLVLAFVLLLLAIPAYAGTSPRVGELANAGQGTFETTLISSNTASAGNFGAGSIIFGFSVHPTGANGACGLYDTASLTSAHTTQGIFIDEGGNDGDEETFQSNWPAPYKLVTDLTVLCSSANAIIYSYPE